MLVDLHRGLSAWPLFPVGFVDLTTEALPVDGGGLVPEPARLLVTLAVHATQHGFLVPLRSVVDALAVVQRLRPDPPRVVETARRWRVTRGTSLLLAWLVRLGLEGGEWDETARALAGNWPVERFVEQLPIVAPTEAGAVLRRERWWRARFVDQPWRTMASDAYRGALWAGDVALRAGPRRWRERIEDVGSQQRD